eukprot:3340668-Ditylum_brightwellii.AAC.1
MQLKLVSAVLLLLCCGYDVEEFDDFTLPSMVWLDSKKEKEKRVHSCLKKLFYKQLDGGERARRL